MEMIGFLAFIFVGMTLLNRIMAGQLITSADMTIMNTMTITRDYNIAGLFDIPVPNTDFFFTGIPHLIRWDYSFFGGSAGLIQYFLYSISAAVAFLAFSVMIGMAAQFLSRTR